MALSGLQAKDLCRIIEVCKTANVSSLDLGPIKITFAQVVLPRAESTVESQVAGEVSGEKSSSKEIEPPKSLVTAADSQVLEDMQRSQLLMDDPVAYERLMVDDHIQRQGIALGGTT